MKSNSVQFIFPLSVAVKIKIKPKPVEMRHLEKFCLAWLITPHANSTSVVNAVDVIHVSKFCKGLE